MAVGKFATAINCIDGRTQRPVSEWIRIQFARDYVDTITHPGPEKALIQGPQAIIETIRKNVGVSVSAHQSQLIAVAAHHQCAGNQVTDDEHKAQVRSRLPSCRRVGISSANHRALGKRVVAGRGRRGFW